MSIREGPTPPDGCECQSVIVAQSTCPQSILSPSSASFTSAGKSTKPLRASMERFGSSMTRSSQRISPTASIGLRCRATCLSLSSSRSVSSGAVIDTSEDVKHVPGVEQPLLRESLDEPKNELRHMVLSHRLCIAVHRGCGAALLLVEVTGVIGPGMMEALVLSLGVAAD